MHAVLSPVGLCIDLMHFHKMPIRPSGSSVGQFCTSVSISTALTLHSSHHQLVRILRSASALMWYAVRARGEVGVKLKQTTEFTYTWTRLEHVQILVGAVLLWLPYACITYVSVAVGSKGAWHLRWVMILLGYFQQILLWSSVVKLMGTQQFLLLFLQSQMHTGFYSDVLS